MASSGKAVDTSRGRRPSSVALGQGHSVGCLLFPGQHLLQPGPDPEGHWIRAHLLRPWGFWRVSETHPLSKKSIFQNLETSAN